MNAALKLRNLPSALDETQHYSFGMWEGSGAFFMYVHDAERTRVLRFRPRPQFTVSEGEEYATKRRSQ